MGGTILMTLIEMERLSTQAGDPQLCQSGGSEQSVRLHPSLARHSFPGGATSLQGPLKRSCELKRNLSPLS